MKSFSNTTNTTANGRIVIKAVLKDRVAPRSAAHAEWRLLALALFALLVIPSALLGSDGDLDVTFGKGGIVTTDFSGNDDVAAAVALQSDGKIVVVGATRLPPSWLASDFALVRYNSDGSLDTDFGTAGKTVTDFFGNQDFANAVAIQPDGKIVVAGASYFGTVGTHFGLARYNRDGSLDTSFDVNGRIMTDMYFGFHALALQRDGKIVVAGSRFTPNPLGSGAIGRFALARYNQDGSLDTSFGMDGNVGTEFPGFSASAYALAIQADNKLVVAGSIGPGPGDFALARYNSNGSLDLTFGTDGRVATDFSGQDDVAYAVAVQADGKILAAGGGGVFESGLRLARYNPDGSLDSTFGADGKVGARPSDGPDARSLIVQPDGKIVIGVSPYVSDAALLRFNPDGSLDTGFGRGGTVWGPEGAAGLAIQPDGKIVGVSVRPGENSSPPKMVADFSVTRYTDSWLTLTLDPPRVLSGDSFTGTFSSSTILNNETYYDVQFRAPGDGTDRVALNWQHGTSAVHIVPADTILGSWRITGVRPHLNVDDHTAAVVSISTELSVAP